MFFISEAIGCPATFQRDRIPRLTQLSILVNAFTSWSCTGFLLASLQPLPCWVSLSCQCCSLSRCWFYKTLLKQRDCMLHFWHKMEIMLDSRKTKNPDITTGLVQHLRHHKHIQQTRDSKVEELCITEMNHFLRIPLIENKLLVPLMPWCCCWDYAHFLLPDAVNQRNDPASSAASLFPTQNKLLVQLVAFPLS